MEDNTKVINRLRRIVGQVKGIERMLESEQCCSDILIQVAAARSAINQVGMLIFENYSHNCLANTTSPEEQQRVMQDLLKTMNKFIKGGTLDGPDRADS